MNRNRLFVLFCVVVWGVFSPPTIQAETEIPVGPGQVCIKYYNYYASLLDWVNGPVELARRYAYVSYEGVGDSRTVHSCVGSDHYPGTLPEGNFFLFQGGVFYQAAIVNIKKIPDPCPYILTYYPLTNPVHISDPTGICAKNYLDKNHGPSPCPTN